MNMLREKSTGSTWHGPTYTRARRQTFSPLSWDISPWQLAIPESQLIQFTCRSSDTQGYPSNPHQ